MLTTREYTVSGRKRSSSTSSEEPLVKKPEKFSGSVSRIPVPNMD